MKILFISMPSIHVIRWLENLKDTSLDLYWFDVLSRGKLDTFDNVKQFVDWEKRKLPYIRGEYFLSKKLPEVYEKVKPIFEVTTNEALEKIILEIQPDVVHSFELHYCSFSVLKTMKKFPDIKWIYSCWGSDIFRHQVLKSDIQKIREVLQQVDFLITDCERDFNLATQYGFKGLFLGVVPGGGGYNIKDIGAYFQDIESRKLILIKGNHSETGRAIFVLKAIKKIMHLLDDYEIYIFSISNQTIEFIEAHSEIKAKIKMLERINQSELFNYFGKAFLYIGNNYSDGLPNTLLESLLLGAIPLQSNPGNATSELIGKRYFGELIDNPENSDEIAEKILKLVKNKQIYADFAKTNHFKAIEDYNYEKVGNSICNIYNLL
ncbi:glycosyltransferase [Flavobacterium soyangense]|uniref:Glycosyltransferase n=1 Tax=Flavobacterium soyangense TaxID=2023265 RepID=A0A930U7A5_9FLAO|nr:glycosyltransferase [Flavobacterium soyangense]MBF2708233.1 glycosyltransferase [Flavobacterium soyangense]